MVEKPARGGVNKHAGDGLVWHKLRVMMQQGGHLDGDAFVGEDDSGRAGFTSNFFQKWALLVRTRKCLYELTSDAVCIFFAKKCTLMVGKCHFHNIDFQ